jgi:hypothetical protein
MGSSPDTHLYEFRNSKGKKATITNKIALQLLRQHVATIDPDYGIHQDEVGLHSFRSSSAMAMYLNGIPVYTIMLLGRWSSDAFLRYIRKQVTEFSNNVSRKMIEQPVYHHIREPSPDDPRNHNALSAAANSGMGYNGTNTNRSVFSVWE